MDRLMEMLKAGLQCYNALWEIPIIVLFVHVLLGIHQVLVSQAGSPADVW